MAVNVRRLPIQLLPDASRVITRYFGPGEINRIRDVVGRILAVPETTVAALVAHATSRLSAPASCDPSLAPTSPSERRVRRTAHSLGRTFLGARVLATCQWHNEVP